MMKNRLVLLFTILLLPFFCHPFADAQALAEEIIYNANDTSKPAGKKIYFYEGEKLVEIKTIDDDGLMNISYKYFYLNDKLTSVQEFNNDVRIKYSVFYYTNDGKIQQKIDFNSSKEQTCIFEYELTPDNRIARIKEYLPDRTYLGSRAYIYNQGRLVAEEHLSASGEVMLKKEYIYQNGSNVQVHYYFKKRKIREIKRTYTGYDGKTSHPGLPENFYDFR